MNQITKLPKNLELVIDRIFLGFETAMMRFRILRLLNALVKDGKARIEIDVNSDDGMGPSKPVRLIIDLGETE